MPSVAFILVESRTILVGQFLADVSLGNVGVTSLTDHRMTCTIRRLAILT